MSDQKRADLARQEAAIAEGDRKFKQMEADIYSGAGEDFQRKFFNMTRTERMAYGLPAKSYGTGTPKPMKKKRSEWRSLCCKRDASNYRSVYLSGKVERYFRCSKCGGECEAILKPVPVKRSS